MSKIKIISREIFYFSFLLLGAFIILEIIWPNIILAYFNLNWLFGLGLLAGLTSLSKK